MTFLLMICLGIMLNIKPGYTQNLEADTPKLPFGEYLSGRHALYNNQYTEASEYYLKALKLDPENIELNQSTISVLISDGRFKDALLIAKRLKKADQEINISKLLLYFEMAKDGHYDAVVKATDQLDDTGILKVTKPIFRAWALAEQGKSSEVEAVIAAFGEGTNFNFFNYYHSALLYDFMGNSVKAGEYYAKTLTEPGLLNLRVVEAYGNYLRRQNKTLEAIEIYQEYLKKTPDNERLKAALIEANEGRLPKALVTNLNDGFAEIFYGISTILMQDNIKPVAINFLQYALYFKDDFVLCHFLLAQILESDKYYIGAARQMEKISKDSPLYFQARLQRAWLYNDLDDDEATINALRKLEAEFPNNREILNSIAEFYRIHARYKEAATAYDMIINNLDQHNEADWLVYYTRGIVLDQEKRWQEAQADFLKALELKPEQPMVLNYLAYSWVDKGLNYSKAKKMLERAVELKPNDGYIIDSLGWALFKMGDNEQAVGVLERAALLQTQDWAINDHLGDAYWIVGRKNEARFQWRHALSLKPDEDKISGIKEKIKNGYTNINNKSN